MEKTYGAFAITLEHTRSFRPEHINKFLFGGDLGNCCNTLAIQGSDVTDRSSKAWLADYFGLATDFEGCISFCPRIKNVIVDLNLYLGLAECYEGMFFRIHAPITWTKWELNMCECIRNSGTNTFLAGYMSTDEIARGQLPDSFMEAVSGNVMFGDMKSPMKYGLMTNCKLTKVGIADIHASLGWNFKTDEDYHFGFFIHAAAPTGTRPSATYLFEPIVGNGKHWELGLGITSSWIFYRSNEYDDRYLGIWLDGTFTHLFKTKQCRSFDFCCKSNSRYMLLQEMMKADGNLTGEADDYTPVKYQYAANLIPAINWSTFNVDVKINFQADVVLKFGYVRENWSMDLGYNLWARTGEKFCRECCDDCCNDSCNCPKMYAEKGCLPVYGRWQGEGYNTIPLGNTTSNATISCCGDVDNSEEAFYTASGNRPVLLLPDTTAATSSIQPLLVSNCNLNLGKSPSAITHKIFWSLNYAWKERGGQEWIPFIGIGWEVEFAQRSKCCGNCCSTCTTSTNGVMLRNRTSSCNSCNSCCDDCCDTCKRAGVYQYGLWFKGGFAFD